LIAEVPKASARPRSLNVLRRVGVITRLHRIEGITRRSLDAGGSVQPQAAWSHHEIVNVATPTVPSRPVLGRLRIADSSQRGSRPRSFRAPLGAGQPTGNLGRKDLHPAIGAACPGQQPRRRQELMPFAGRGASAVACGLACQWRGKPRCTRQAPAEVWPVRHVHPRNRQ